jgi:hypothetical protein
MITIKLATTIVITSIGDRDVVLVVLVLDVVVDVALP